MSTDPLFTYELARRHGHELIANAIHPGLVRTGIGRSFGPRQILTPSFPRIRILTTQLTAISPRRSAPTVAALATEPVSTNGGYYDRARTHPILRTLLRHRHRRKNLADHRTPLRPLRPLTERPSVAPERAARPARWRELAPGRRG